MHSLHKYTWTKEFLDAVQDFQIHARLTDHSMRRILQGEDAGRFSWQNGSLLRDGKTLSGSRANNHNARVARYWDQLKEQRRKVSFLLQALEDGEALPFTIEERYLQKLSDIQKERLFLENWLKNLPETNPEVTDIYHRIGAHTLPTRPLLDLLRSSVLEVGAGSGFWGAALSQQGVDVICTDAAAHASRHGLVGLWFPVAQMDAAESIRAHPERTVLAVWPDCYTDHLEQIITSLHPGQKAFLILPTFERHRLDRHPSVEFICPADPGSDVYQIFGH
jgi:hypothetical protein